MEDVLSIRGSRSRFSDCLLPAGLIALPAAGACTFAGSARARHGCVPPAKPECELSAPLLQGERRLPDIGPAVHGDLCDVLHPVEAPVAGHDESERKPVAVLQ